MPNRDRDLHRKCKMNTRYYFTIEQNKIKYLKVTRRDDRKVGVSQVEKDDKASLAWFH